MNDDGDWSISNRAKYEQRNYSSRLNYRGWLSNTEDHYRAAVLSGLAETVLKANGFKVLSATIKSKYDFAFEPFIKIRIKNNVT